MSSFHERKQSFMEDLTVEVYEEGKDRIQWKLGELVGEGAFAKVYECINIGTGELLAAKCYKSAQDPKRLEKEFANMRREIRVLRQLNHPNVVKYY
jgi:mitogen-activated protein kinase kinase kinase 2